MRAEGPRKKKKVNLLKDTPDPKIYGEQGRRETASQGYASKDSY